MLLSKSCEYGIRALITVMTASQEGQKILLAEITKKAELPAPFTANLMKSFVKQGLVSSTKGRNGGFYFTEDQKSLVLMDIIKATDGNALFTDCALGLLYCSDNNPCPVHGEFVKIRDDFRDMCLSTSVKELAEKLEKGEAVLVK